MELNVGDYVKTESGEIGKVIHIDRLTVFVSLAQHTHPEPHEIRAFLKSALIKVDPPSHNDLSSEPGS
jgi:preprotein translocase subunit YajC